MRCACFRGWHFWWELGISIGHDHLKLVPVYCLRQRTESCDYIVGIVWPIFNVLHGVVYVLFCGGVQLDVGSDERVEVVPVAIVERFFLSIYEQ